MKPPRVYERNTQARVPEQVQRESTLPSNERSRRRFERRLICTLAQNPLLALEHANTLAQTQWHDPVNAQLAECVLDVLSDDPAASPARIVSAASAKVPRAAGALTSQANPNEVPFLVEELEIGDMEASLLALNAQMKSDAVMPEDERNLMFQAAVELQKTIAIKRAAHQPPLQ